MNEIVGNKDIALNQVDIFEKAFSVFTTKMIDSMKEVSELTEKKRASSILMGFAIVVLFAGLFMKLKIFSVEFSSLEPSEFISVLIVSMILLIIGSYLRLYIYKMESEINRELRGTGKEMMGKQFDLIKEMAIAGKPQDGPNGGGV